MVGYDCSLLVTELRRQALAIHAQVVIRVQHFLGNPYGDSTVWCWRENGKACDDDGRELHLPGGLADLRPLEEQQADCHRERP